MIVLLISLSLSIIFDYSKSALESILETRQHIKSLNQKAKQYNLRPPTGMDGIIQSANAKIIGKVPDTLDSNCAHGFTLYEVTNKDSKIAYTDYYAVRY